MKDTLKTAAEFRAARKGRWRKTPFGTVVVTRGEHTAYGVVVTKTLGNAVARNTAKRKARAALAPLLPKLPTGTVVLVMPTEAVLTASSTTYNEALAKVVL